MTEKRLRLQTLENEASDWLAAQPTATNTTALFDAFKGLPYLRDDSALHPAYVAQTEQTLETTFCVGLDGGLPLPLPQDRGQCACTELQDVAVEKIHLSGSGREGSDVRLFPEEASDIDVMLQLGPVHVTEDCESQHSKHGSRVLGDSMREESKVVPKTDAGNQFLANGKEGDNEAGDNYKDDKETCRASKGASEKLEEKNSEADGETLTETGSVSSEDTFLSCEDIPALLEGACASPTPSPPPSGQTDGITVALEPAAHRGFFLLRHRRLPNCRHRDRLPFSAHRVVTLMDSVRASFTDETPIVSGPAVSITIDGVLLDPKAIDLVACVLCPHWPIEDFSSRQRSSGQLSEDLVARLCRTPAFLVPVGFAGSETEELEWRLSFSRHEYIAYRSMTEDQRLCLTTLKHCRAVIGEAAKPLKSYYLKTALMWLVESRAADQWTLETMYDSLLLILHYLDVCLRRGYLPCYFWPDVNLLASRSEAERAELAAAVAELRRRLLPTVLALVSDWLGQPVPALAQWLLLDGRMLSRDQFWDMTGAHWVRELIGGGHRWKRPVHALRDLAFNGKIPLKDDNLSRLPFCSALELSVEAAREFNRTMKREASGCSRGLVKEIRNVIGLAQPILKMAKQVKRPSQPEDSWMASD